MKMFRVSIDNLDGMYVRDLLVRLDEVFVYDRKATLSIEENESWDPLSNEVTTTYDLVCYHKDERNS